MSLKHAKEFVDNLTNDPELAATINKASNPEIFSYAKANGCDFTVDEFHQAMSQGKSGNGTGGRCTTNG